MKPTLTFHRGWLSLLALVALPLAASAQTTWQLTVGSQSPDCQYIEGRHSAADCQMLQGMAFEPNEIWIHAGDSINWTFRSDQEHTVTLLKPGQVRPSNGAGCTSIAGSATSPSNSNYDPWGGAAQQCAHSGTMGKGTTYTVQFPSAGNYKFTCLLHASMYGTVHVLASSATLPHDQEYYDSQAKVEAKLYTSDVPLKVAQRLESNQVAMGTGMLIGSGGGWGYESVFRFLQTVTRVHVGDTVEWINFDPVAPHTVTFGCPTDDAICPTGGGTGARVNTSGPIALAADGVLEAEIARAFNPDIDGINSGILIGARQDAGGQVQANPAATTFRVKFDFPGTYRYICEIHDQLGMIGWVVVLPKEAH